MGLYPYNETLFYHKKQWNSNTCSHMDGTRDSHTEWNKSERQRQIPYDFTYN